MNDIRNIDRIHPGAYPVNRNIKQTTETSAVEPKQENDSEHKNKQNQNEADDKERDTQSDKKKKLVAKRRIIKKGRSRRIDIRV